MATQFLDKIKIRFRASNNDALVQYIRDATGLTEIGRIFAAGQAKLAWFSHFSRLFHDSQPQSGDVFVHSSSLATAALFSYTASN